MLGIEVVAADIRHGKKRRWRIGGSVDAVNNVGLGKVLAARFENAHVKRIGVRTGSS
jgi:hypothetical protein